MIQTGKQATKAVKEIQKKTDWSLREIGSRIGYSHNTIAAIESGVTKRPKNDIMLQLDGLLRAVREME